MNNFDVNEVARTLPVNSDNTASLKTALQLGFSDCGSIFSVSEDGSILERRNFVLFTPSVKMKK